MTSAIPSKILKSSKPSANAIRALPIAWLVGLGVVLATAIAFLPTLFNGFVEWDDYENLLSNPSFRGLGWSHIAWMFTTFHMGPYQPLSWLTLGLDYAIWGLNPLGYHLTNLLLHAANALACYLVSRRLFALTWNQPDSEKSWPVIFSAAFAALFFSLHPLRVESVAWVTERRDVLSGLFYLWTIYAYLRANAEVNDRAQSRWKVATLILYLLSLLSKATAITFPLVLLLLDIYPLRRLTWDVRQWIAPAVRPLWHEKIPFIVAAAVFAALAIMGQQESSAFKSLESYGVGQRLAQVFFGAGFYVWKTVMPVGLSPLYQVPPNYSFRNAGSLIGGASALVISIGLFRVKDRWPAGLTCWLYYLVVLAPTSGLVPTGPQLAADRYSYLPCLSWAVLAGGLLLFLLRRRPQRRPGFPATATFAAVALAIVVGLGALTWQQSRVWRDTETLWRRVLEIDPNSSFARYNLARYIARRGRYQEAINHYREALRVQPNDPDTHNNLGLVLALTGEYETSLAEFRRAIEIDPRYAKGYFNLGRVLARRGDLDEAADNLGKALQLSPSQAEIRLALSSVLARQGRMEEAEAQLEAVVRLKPDSADAHATLARWLASQGKKDAAARHYQEALRLIQSQARNTSRSRDDSENHEIHGSGDSFETPGK
jgi:protein O-mannosyl-transferase